MEKNSVFRFVLALLFVMHSGRCFAQNYRIGLHSEVSFIHWNHAAEDHFSAPFFDDLSLEDTYIPEAVGGSFDFIFPEFTVRASLSYGFASSKYAYDVPDAALELPSSTGTPQSQQIEKLNFEKNSKVGGFSADAVLMVPFSMGRTKMLSIYPGIGISYLNYQFSGDWNVTDEDIDYNNISTIYSARGDYDPARLTGVAQYFLIGLDVKATSNLHFFIEFTRIGLDFLTIATDLNLKQYAPDATGTRYEMSYNKKIGEIKEDYQTSAGLSDIGISFGVGMSL
jgi:hypothetical protein